MDSDPGVSSGWQRIAPVLRAELAYSPGRAWLVGRIVLACTSVMILAMVFRIPGAALGAYYPLLLSRDSPRATLRSATRLATICTLGTGEILLGAMLFSGSPFLHFFWVAGSVFGVFYLISSLEKYDSALALGLVIANGITTWDLPVSPDMRVKQTLFTMLAILMACVVSVGIEYFLAQGHPPDAVLAAIRQRLTTVGNLLGEYAGDAGNNKTRFFRLRNELFRFAMKGTGQVRERLAHASYEAQYKEALSAALALSGRLVELAANLCELNPAVTERDRSYCSQIAGSIAAIDARLSHREAPDWLDLPEEQGSSIGILVEIERNVDLIAECFLNEEQPVHHLLPEPKVEQSAAIFSADAFTSRTHVKFAIRGSLTALACYVLYMSVGWTGLSASIATCILTALKITGASRHKQLMRFAGVVLGACVLGFGTQALILPQIDSLVDFALLFALVIALSAWVGTSGPRIAYAGIQMVLAYNLVNLNRFAINTSLVPARDTVLGVLLGIGSMWLIFDHLWAEPSIDLTRSLFLSNLKEIAELDLPSHANAAMQFQNVMVASERLNRNFDQLRSLVDFAVFEAFPKTEEEIFWNRCVKDMQPQLRSFLLVKAGLLHHQAISASAETREIVSWVQKLSSAILLEAVQTLEAYPVQPVPLPAADGTALKVAIHTALKEGSVQGSADVIIESHLCSSLLDLADHLRASVRAPKIE
ncbi:MAG TPA: FUSC family protein [Acidobacteriaceae bacterium]|nr:FUSC family protein [Acidobacteriaceae bacterium]